MTIKRYDVSGWDAEIDESRDGDWVKVEDHDAVVAMLVSALKNARANAYEAGSVERVVDEALESIK